MAATRRLAFAAPKTAKPSAYGSAAPRRLLNLSRSPSISATKSNRLALGAAAGVSGVLLYSAWSASQSSSYHADAPTAPPNSGPAAAVLIGQKAGEDDEYHIDASTKLPLARRINTPACLGGGTASPSSSGSDKPYLLLASGVRTVSFLRVQVYVVALYVDEAAYNRFLSSTTRRPATSSASAAAAAEPTAENDTQAFMSSLLSSGQVPCVLRVAPVRNTDFAHLRDGFGRAVQARVKVVRKALQQPQGQGQPLSPPSEEEEQSLADGMLRLRECFPKASLQKGEMLDLVFHPSKSAGAGGAGVDLTLEHGGTVLGSVEHDGRARVDLDVPRLLMEAYVAKKDPVSAVFKQALTEKLFPASPQP